MAGCAARTSSEDAAIGGGVGGSGGAGGGSGDIAVAPGESTVGGSTGSSVQCPEDGCSSPEPGQLTAGEWRDLDHWSFWADLQDGTSLPDLKARWGIDTLARIPVHVHAGDAALLDAKVTLVGAEGAILWQARTDAEGRAELFAGPFGTVQGPYTVRAELGGESAEAVVESTMWMEPVALELAIEAAPITQLDLMLVVDTTGSMGDELSYLQRELLDVVERAQALAGDAVDLRVGLTFYRDDGDDYVVRGFPFTSDIAVTSADLGAQSANGGGDWPEAVHRGLESALAADFRDTPTVRLLLLVLDAPPHEGQETVGRVQDAVEDAAAKGVRIVPVAASGIDKGTEGLLRQAAILTGGTYVFLTNDSGIGGDHIEPTIGDYQVEYLNDLLVRLIHDAIAPAP
jgi:hypothetical protein